MKKVVCILCPKGCEMTVTGEGDDIKVNGNKCDKGIDFAKKESFSPERTLTSTVHISGGIHTMLPVKTSTAIPKDLMAEAVELIGRAEVSSPVKAGDVIIANILGTGADIIATRDM